jgi:hypothetical protein
MYQVTAIYQGMELAYGLGDSKEYAIEECLDSIDTNYVDHIENIELQIVHNSKITIANAVEYFFKDRQYF